MRRTLLSLVLCLFWNASGITITSGPLELVLASPVVPLVHGNQLLFQDYRQGAYRIFQHDLGTSVTTQLRNNTMSYLYPLDFSGDYFSWIEYRSGGVKPAQGLPVTYEVKIFTINNSSEQIVSTNGAYKEYLASDPQWVAWTDYRNSTASDTFSDVYVFNVGQNMEMRITAVPAYKASVHVRGRWVVWTDYRNAFSNPKNADIYAYDLTLRQESPVCLATGFQDQPRVAGETVVWQDYRNAGLSDKNADIYSFNLTSKTETPVCTAPGYQTHPQIDGRFVVWQDYRNAVTDTLNADIYLYDLLTRTELAVTNQPGFQDAPSLFGNKLAWQDYTDNKVHLAVIDTTGPSIRVIKNMAVSSPLMGIRPVYDIQGRTLRGATTVFQPGVQNSKGKSRVGLAEQVRTAQ